MDDDFAVTLQLQGISHCQINSACSWSPERKRLEEILPQPQPLGHPQISTLIWRVLPMLPLSMTIDDDADMELERKPFQKSKHMQENFQRSYRALHLKILTGDHTSSNFFLALFSLLHFSSLRSCRALKNSAIGVICLAGC